VRASLCCRKKAGPGPKCRPWWYDAGPGSSIFSPHLAGAHSSAHRPQRVPFRGGAKERCGGRRRRRSGIVRRWVHREKFYKPSSKYILCFNKFTQIERLLKSPIKDYRIYQKNNIKHIFNEHHCSLYICTIYYVCLDFLYIKIRYWKIIKCLPLYKSRYETLQIC